MAADEGSSGVPNPQGSESREMAVWQGEVTANVRENARRLDAINGQIERIEKGQELTRSDVRSLAEKLDTMTLTQTVIATNTSGIDWKTVIAVVTGVSTPIAMAIIAAGGGS